MTQSLALIGWREWVSLSELDLPLVKAKIDTGAKTSTLHAIHVDRFSKRKKDYVRFDVHPIQRNAHITRTCEALLLDERVIKSSSGHAEVRHIIKTNLVIGEIEADIELTLTNRDQMGFRMLLGRNALKDHFLVEPGASYLLGKYLKSTQRKLYKH